MAMHPNEDTNRTLGNLIAQQIAESSPKRITFAEYMGLALYHPLHGYYATNAANIGEKGDFFTSPHLGKDFGELLAEQVVQMWEILQRPDSFSLIEMGAGQGLLAADMLDYLNRNHAKFFRSLEYIIVERADALVAEQRRQLQALEKTGIRLRWCTVEEIAANSVTGCFFSNELIDALPVHQVMVEAGQLQEIYVTTVGEGDNWQFLEITSELSTPKVAEYFDLVSIDLLSNAYPDRYRTEVNLAALDWIKTVADRLQRGYVITIDYGYSADRYYNPVRSQGTLQCYYHHAHHSDPYIHIGQQDITAHVDFTALERHGERQGLQTLGFTRQGLFLMALGLGDRLAALRDFNATNRSDIQTTLRRREALHQLASPLGLGNFGVLIQGRGLSSSESVHPLKGLGQP